MRAAIYARKSTEQAGADADAKSVANQIDNARAFAARKGLDASPRRTSTAMTPSAARKRASWSTGSDCSTRSHRPRAVPSA